MACYWTKYDHLACHGLGCKQQWDHEINIVLECDCTKYEAESLFVEFMFNGAMYTVGGIYRHHNGNVSHFASALECVLHKINTNRSTLLAGDINIDIIKFSNEEVMSYMSCPN